MMELVTVKDGSWTLYVEKNLIKQVVIRVIGEPGAEDSGEPEKMMEVIPGIWEKKCDTIE